MIGLLLTADFTVKTSDEYIMSVTLNDGMLEVVRKVEPRWAIQNVSGGPTYGIQVFKDTYMSKDDKIVLVGTIEGKYTPEKTETTPESWEFKQ